MMKVVSAKNIEAAVFSAIDRLREVLPPDAHLEHSRTAPLLADGTSLDSMAVVNLLVLIEEEMLSTLDVEIILAGADGESGIDPEALGTIGALIDAICQHVT
jgi:acyl carrier protein